MPVSQKDDDISNALNIARADIGNGNAIQYKINNLNQALTGLDLEANTPQFNTGIGGAGLPSRILPNQPSNLSNQPITRSGADLLRKDPALAANPPVMSKYGRPFHELEFTYVPKENLVPWKELNPETLFKEKAYITPAIWDRTSGNMLVQSVLGNKLSSSVNTQGGPDFQRSEFAQGENPAAAASRDAAVKGMMTKIANQNVPEDRPLYISSTLMGLPASDSSVIMAQALLRQIDPSKLSKSGIDYVNKVMSKEFDNWPGIENPQAVENLMKNLNVGAKTSTLPASFDTATAYNAGFPDVGASRFAITDPRLFSPEQLASGYSMSKIDLSKQPFQIENGHETYPTKIPSVSGYEGGLKYQVPAEIMFSDWAKTLPTTTKRGIPPTPTEKQQSLMSKMFAQEAHQEWLDNIMRHMEEHKKVWGYRKGGSISDDNDIDHALNIARKHFDDGGEAASPWSAAAKNDQPSQNESLNAFIGREDPQRYTDPEGNRLTAEERGPAPPQGGDIVQAGLGQSIFRDNSGELSVGQNTRGNVAGPTANQIATEQAKQEENRAIAANSAMAQRVGPMTGQPETPTFTGNTTEEQQLKDAEASQRAAINAAITGANYTAPGTVSAADVATPVQSNITSNTSPFSDIANRYTTAAQTGAANLGDMAGMLEHRGAITSATGTPLQSLAAAQPNAALNLGQPLQISPVAENLVAPVANNTPLEASALYKATTFEPSVNAALRAARDAITQDMGQPDIAVARTTGLGSATPADLPAVKAAPQTSTTANETPRIPVESFEDPALIAAYNAKYNLAGPKNTMADMALGQRMPNITTNNPLINTVQGANNFLTNLFTPSYNLGSEQYNKISQNPEPEPTMTLGGHGGGQQQVQTAPVTETAAAAPVAAPVVPGMPVPYKYAKRTPYLDYGAYGSGIGNISPISYANAINWSLVPGYRASGGKVGENNALANAIRLLAMQNRS